MLISTSTDKVERWRVPVQEAGSSTSAIVESEQRVSDIIGEICTAASEQSNGTDQGNTAVRQLDTMTQ